MNRRALLVGVVLIIVGIVAAGSSISTTLPSASSVLVQSQNLTVTSYNYSYISIPLNQTSSLYLFFNSTVPVTFLLTNETAMSNLSGLSTQGLLEKAQGLEGKGVLEILNGTTGSFPYSFSSKGIISYSSNFTIFPKATYFAIFANTNKQAALVRIRFAEVLVGSLSSNVISSLATIGVLSIVGSFIALIGFLLAIASLFMHGKKNQSQQEIEPEIEETYKRLEANAKKRRKYDTKHRPKSS